MDREDDDAGSAATSWGASGGWGVVCAGVGGAIAGGGGGFFVVVVAGLCFAFGAESGGGSVWADGEAADGGDAVVVLGCGAGGAAWAGDFA